MSSLFSKRWGRRPDPGRVKCGCGVWLMQPRSIDRLKCMSCAGDDPTAGETVAEPDPAADAVAATLGDYGPPARPLCANCCELPPAPGDLLYCRLCGPYLTRSLSRRAA